MLRKESEVSQSALEFALVLPVLLLIIFGIIEMGHLIFVYASVLNASREAARYGSVTGWINGNPQYQDCNGIASAATNLKFLANFTDSDVEIYYDQGPGTSQIGPCSAMSSSQWSSIATGSRIIVTVTSPYSLIVPLVPIPDFSMISTSRRMILGSIAISGTVAAPPSGSNHPTISSITPNIGPAHGGEIVTINGSDLDNLSSVTFGGLTGISCMANSATQVTCTTPVDDAGLVDVALRTVYGTYTAVDAYTYVGAPVITNIDPPAGPLNPVSNVTINGTGLFDGSVTFGSIGATCTIDTDTQMTCIPPASSVAGPVDVSVSTIGGDTTASSPYAYVAAPVIANLAPAAAASSGGLPVVITGTNLTGGNVYFDNVIADCTVDSDTQITCKAPTHAAGQVAVGIITLGGAAATPATAFTYQPSPYISSMVPSAGPVIGGGSSIVINGQYLRNTIVKFGSAAAACTGFSDRKITCVLPAGEAAGQVDVTIIKMVPPGGTTTVKKAFTYVLPPSIISVSPKYGSLGGGTTVKITGTSLMYANLSKGIIFDTQPATNCVVKSDTLITCLTPAHSVGPVMLSITTLGGAASLADAYTYTPITVSDNPTELKPLAENPGETLQGTGLTGLTTIGYGGFMPAGCKPNGAIVEIPFCLNPRFSFSTQ